MARGKEKEEPRAAAVPSPSGAIIEVKATNEEVMKYQKEGILVGWDPANGIAKIRS